MVVLSFCWVVIAWVVVAVVEVDDDAFALRRNLALLEDKA
jgi:uncharacterized protein with GYD domain